MKTYIQNISSIFSNRQIYPKQRYVSDRCNETKRTFQYHALTMTTQKNVRSHTDDVGFVSKVKVR